MKKLVLAIMFMAFLVVPMTVNAGECERYGDELINQTFQITVDETDFTLYFGESVFGPCPEGIAVLGYTDVQIIDGIEYVAEILIDLNYSTTAEYVIVEGLLFLLIDKRLILLPEIPWVFNLIEE